MIRKTINIILSTLLIITTTGFSISKHYCHGDLISVAINKDAESCCDMEMADHCKNDEEHIQLENDFIYKDQQDNNAKLFPLDAGLFSLTSSLTENPGIENESTPFFSRIIHPPEIQIFLSLIQAYLL